MAAQSFAIKCQIVDSNGQAKNAGTEEARPLFLGEKNAEHPAIWMKACKKLGSTQKPQEIAMKARHRHLGSNPKCGIARACPFFSEQKGVSPCANRVGLESARKHSAVSNQAGQKAKKSAAQNNARSGLRERRSPDRLIRDVRDVAPLCCAARGRGGKKNRKS